MKELVNTNEKMTRTLNLDRGFVSMNIEEIEFDMFQFPGGEMHIKLDNSIDYSMIDACAITSRVRSGDDIMKILIAKDALQRKGVNCIELIMPYLPYARQDRRCNDGESFTLKVFSDLINSANFKKVLVLDAHSDVTPAVLLNCENIPNYKYVEKAYFDIVEYDNADVLLVSPDAGANKKLNGLVSNVLGFKGIIKCDKSRDIETGKIIGVDVFSDDLNGACCLIVDDICDGGRTFIELAKELKNKNVGNLYLFVTHGIFSKGFNELSKYFKTIYTTNSFQDIDHPLVKQYNLFL